MALITSSLPQYVDENNKELLRNAILGSESAKLFTLQTGVKNQSALNYLDTNIVFQDASKCGFKAQGDSTITQRIVKTVPLKINMSWCPKELLNTCLQHEVRVAAGQENLPYEQKFVEDVMAHIHHETERMLWQGDTAKSGDNTLKWMDGILKRLKTDITIEAQKPTITLSTPAEVVKAVDDVVMAIPVEVLDKAEILLGWDLYRMYVMGLQKMNLFHNAGDNLDKGVTTYQGSSIKVRALAGLNGTKTIIGADPKNFVYATDLQHDEEKFRLWFSEDADEFRFKNEFMIGSDYFFPNKVVMATLGV